MIKPIITTFFMLCFNFTISISQESEVNFCNNEIGKKIDFDNVISNKFYVEYNQKGDKIDFVFINTTIHTMYLFKSYFSDDIYSSKYLHWVNYKEKTYTISFVPLVSNLTTKMTDKRILGENRIVNLGQVLYEFIELPSNSYSRISVDIKKMFKNQYLKNNAVKSQEYSQLNKFQSAKFKQLTTTHLQGKYDLLFSFGVYSDVEFICKQSNYYLKETEFNNHAKAFKIIKVPVVLTKDRPRFLK